MRQTVHVSSNAVTGYNVSCCSNKQKTVYCRMTYRLSRNIHKSLAPNARSLAPLRHTKTTHLCKLSSIASFSLSALMCSVVVRLCALCTQRTQHNEALITTKHRAPWTLLCSVFLSSYFRNVCMCFSCWRNQNIAHREIGTITEYTILYVCDALTGPMPWSCGANIWWHRCSSSRIPWWKYNPQSQTYK